MVTFNLKEFITRRLPVLTWIGSYDFNKFVFDFVAGVTVGLMAMPQSLANAALAGIPSENGLYSAFVGGFVSFFLGTNKCVTVGSEAVVAVMVYEQTKGRNIDYAILLCFLTGVVQLLMFAFRLDVLMDFFSIPLVSGYITASSLIIASSQLKNLFGLKVTSSGFLDDIVTVIKNVEDIKYADLGLGIVSICILISLRQIQHNKFVSADGTAAPGVWNRVINILLNARNVFVVVICAVIAYFYETNGDGSPFTLTGKVTEGLPSFQLPPFGTVDQKTHETVPFLKMVSDLGVAIILIPVVSALTNIAIVKSFATNGKVDASQELFCIGMIHLISSFFSSMPGTASFSRSAVNNFCNVQTQAGGVITSLLVLLTLAFLTPSLYYVPKTSLAAIVISAIIFMMQLGMVKPIWRSSKRDFCTMMVTFFGCLLLEIQYGILLGLLVNCIFLLFTTARPTVVIDIKKNKSGTEYMMITPKSSLYFPSVDYVNTKIGKAVTSSEVMPVLINCQYMTNIDFTAATGISYLMEEFIQRKQSLHFVGTQSNVTSGLKDMLEQNFHSLSSIEEYEELLQDMYCTGTEKRMSKRSSYLLRKFSVPLNSVITIDDEPVLKRRHSNVHK